MRQRLIPAFSMLCSISALAVLGSGCQVSPTSTVQAVPAKLQVCVVADMGTVDPDLQAHALDKLAAATGNQEIWALSSFTDGSLISYDEYYDVLRADAEARFSYQKLKFGTVQKTLGGLLSDDVFKGFSAKVDAADRLCDLNVPSVGGTTYHYLHGTRRADGTLQTFGAFVSKNPEGRPDGQDQADIARLFESLRDSFE